MANTTRKGKQSLLPDFIKWSEHKEPVTGRLIAVNYIDMRGVATPKYTLETDTNRVSFLGTTQLVEALADVPMGCEVEIIPIGKETTTGGFKVNTFEVYLLDGVDPQTGEIFEPE